MFRMSAADVTVGQLGDPSAPQFVKPQKKSSATGDTEPHTVKSSSRDPSTPLRTTGGFKLSLFVSAPSRKINKSELTNDIYV